VSACGNATAPEIVANRNHRKAQSRRSLAGHPAEKPII
jgi:hypothetical protein